MGHVGDPALVPGSALVSAPAVEPVPSSGQ